jgi:hypothetical protein
VIGYMDDQNQFHVARLARYAAAEDSSHVLSSVSKRCIQFNVRCIAADGGGGGFHLNRLLYDRLQVKCPFYGIHYSASDHKQLQDGVLWRWTVYRSATIGILFGRVKKKTIQFPTVQECGSYLDEICCEIGVHDKD